MKSSPSPSVNDHGDLETAARNIQSHYRGHKQREIYANLQAEEKRNKEDRRIVTYDAGGDSIDRSTRPTGGDSTTGEKSDTSGSGTKEEVGEGHYKTLGLPRSATKSQITHAYRKLAIKNHPDKNLFKLLGVLRKKKKHFFFFCKCPKNIF